MTEEETGRAAAGKHRARPAEVHMRTVPILTDRWRERAQVALGAAVFIGLVALTGLIEGSTWPM